MLGFTVLSFVLLNVGHDSVAAFAFVCSLCFKQMALYYSPAIFAYLLGRCLMLPLDKGYVCRWIMVLPSDFLNPLTDLYI